MENQTFTHESATSDTEDGLVFLKPKPKKEGKELRSSLGCNMQGQKLELRWISGFPCIFINMLKPT